MTTPTEPPHDPNRERALTWARVHLRRALDHRRDGDGLERLGIAGAALARRWTADEARRALASLEGHEGGEADEIREACRGLQEPTR